MQFRPARKNARGKEEQFSIDPRSQVRRDIVDDWITWLLIFSVEDVRLGDFLLEEVLLVRKVIFDLMESAILSFRQAVIQEQTAKQTDG